MHKVRNKSLKFNFMMNAILTMSSFIFPLITFPYVSRILLPSGTGRVSFATSVISYFALFSQLGIPTYGIRACARVRDNDLELTRTVQELFIINLVTCAVSYVALFATLLVVPRFQEDRVLFLILSLTLLLNAIGMEWLYKALEQYTYIAVRSIVFKIVAVVAMFLMVHEQSDYVVYGGISILASSASQICNFFNVHRHVSLKPVFHYNFRRHLSAVVVFFAMSCATTIYLHLDTVMLGFMTTDTDVGYYQAAVKVKNVLVSAVTSLGVVLLPRVSYYIEHGLKEEFFRITRKALNFVTLLAMPLMLYFMLYAKECILLLSGMNYAGAVVPMQVIMPTLLFIGFTNVMGIQILVPLGRERTVLVSEIAGAVVDLILNLILIPQLAATGAAIGTLVAEIVVWVTQYAALRDIVKNSYRRIRFCSIVYALVLGVAASFWVRLMEFGNFFTLMISAVLFFSVYLGVLTVTKEPLVTELERQLGEKMLHRIMHRD